jgi:hypothetical protein
VKFAAGRQMFCPKCGRCLNAPLTATGTFWSDKGGEIDVTACGPCFDELAERTAAKAAEAGIPFQVVDVYDGRKLWHPQLPLEVR